MVIQTLCFELKLLFSPTQLWVYVQNFCKTRKLAMWMRYLPTSWQHLKKECRRLIFGCGKHCIKLMRSNQPQAKYRFKLDSNCLSINFFDPKLSLESDSLRQNWFQQITKDQKFNFRSILILIDFFNFQHKLTFLIKIDLFDLKIDFFDLLIDFFDLLIDFFDL